MIETKKILYVEDDIIAAMYTNQLLSDAGYKVVHVFSGEEAIQILKQKEKFDLIIMDIDLGSGMDGTEAAEIILKEHNLPLLFLSSHTEKYIVEKTEQITNYGYVVKSSSFTVLDASIKMAFKLFNAKNNILNQRRDLDIQNKKLKELNYALSLAQKLSHVGNWTWDMATDTAEWSDEMYNIFGVNADNFYPSNANVNKTVLPEDLYKMEQGVSSLLNDKLFVPFEFRIKRPTGEIRNLYIIALEISQGKLFGVTMDITKD